MPNTDSTVLDSRGHDKVRVDLHCHSLASDATLTPDQVADGLAAAGVVAAALTDHDTLEGLAEFRARLARRGVGFIPGVEITTEWRSRELHLLAYGFDIESTELHAALRAIRRGQSGGARRLSELGPDSVPRGRLAIADAITLVHRAGGKTVLAHPLATAQGAALREWLMELKALGLDGIEALYRPYPAPEQAQLLKLAGELDLFVSAGSDWHGQNGAAEPGVDMPAPLWRAFRMAVCCNNSGTTRPARHSRPARDWLPFGLRIVLPVLLASGLFVTALFAVLLPAVERALIDRKRDLIRDLTRSACSILADYERQAAAGALPQAEARALARERIKALRYGNEGKDYFWIQDLTPRMIMHPYRPELDGQDLSNYRDARGNRIFVQFAQCVRSNTDGYVSYVWQWQDDVLRQAPKESYVHGFKPWDWLVGTGMYVDDVKAQLAGIRAQLTRISLGIAGVVGLMLGYLVAHSLRAERKRADAEDALRESNERYRLLVEAATEGSLLIADNRCRYANPKFRALLGYAETEIELLGLDDILPGEEPRNQSLHTAIAELLDGTESEAGYSGLLRRRDGTTTECAVSLSRLPDHQREFILMARETDPLHRHNIDLSGGATDWRLWLRNGLCTPGAQALDECDAIAGAPSAATVADICRHAPVHAAALLAAGARAWHATSLLSAIHDAAVARLITLAQAELGPPPCAFTFLALGSFGREEPTLASDQDNALLYDGPANDSRLADYFTALGARVCNSLQAGGYPFCRGQTLAGNRRWCQPLATWKQYFSDWIRTAAPRELMECSICFDLRSVAGDPALIDAIRRHIRDELRASPAFLPRFADHSLQFKPPLRLFGRTLVRGEPAGTLNLKDALMPVVGFARLYALQRDVTLTGTRPRLDALTTTGLLSPVVRADIDLGWDFLVRLRLSNQIQQRQTGLPPDNCIQDRELPAMEQAMLDQVFHRVVALQKMIRHDFLGDS